MPTRADLSSWLAYATRARVPLQGASDYIVSEAVYLADPEGNGIEIYADRPVSRWRDVTGAIRLKLNASASRTNCCCWGEIFGHKRGWLVTFVLTA